MSEKLIEDPEDIQLNENQEIQQILGSPPNWILRWGIFVFFLTTMGLLAISWLVKYPDIIPARVILTTENPPIRIFARTNGKLSELLVTDKEQVKKGQLLAVQDNTANREDIAKLRVFLDNIKDNNFLSLTLPRQLSLGSLQSNYAQFSQKFDDYTFFLRRNIDIAKINALKEQINQIKVLNSSLERQRETHSQVVELALKNLKRNESLVEKKVASAREVETAESEYLQQKQQLESLSTSIINNNIRVEDIEIQILDLQNNKLEGKNTKQLAMQENLERMRNELKNWELNFLITAPIDGKVSMARIWSQEQYVKANEEVMAIVPNEKSEKIIAKAMLPNTRSGKIEEGMPVNIRFDDYSYQEFGSVDATIKSISLVPQEGTYLAEIDIPQKIVTTYGKEIPFRQEMQGTGNIITEDRRILDRIFDKVISSIKNR